MSLTKYVELYKKHARQFEQVFGQKLKLYWDNMTGFNIVKFDDEIVLSGDSCMKDKVQERWGQAGVDLMMALIS